MIVDDRAKKQRSVTNCWILNARFLSKEGGRVFDSISRARCRTAGQKSTISGGVLRRGVLYRLKYIDVTRTARCRARFIERDSLSSSPEIVHRERVPLVLARSPVSLWSNLCGFATSVTVGFPPLLPSIYTCTRRFSSTRTSCSLSYIEHVVVRDSKPRGNVTNRRLACLSRLIDGEFSGHWLREWKPANWWIVLSKARCSSSLREKFSIIYFLARKKREYLKEKKKILHVARRKCKRRN